MLAGDAQAESGSQIRGDDLLGPPSRLSAWLLGIVLSGLWTWWALADGGFFNTTMLPGSALLMLTIAIVLAYAPLPISLRGPQGLAVGGLVVLSAWSLVSILWSPAPDQALENSQRAFLYAASFLAGLLLATVLRRRLLLSLAPLLIAGAVAAVVTTVKILVAETPEGLVDEEGTLFFPFGYRNANAGFFVMVGFCSLALLARPANGVLLRASMSALATLALALAAISQSRGSLLGAAAAALVLLIASPNRGRAIIGLLAAAIPIAVAFPELIGPYNAASDVLPVLPELETASQAAIAAAAGSALFCTLWAIFDRRVGSKLDLPRPSRTVAISGAIVCGVVAIVVGVTIAGSPTEWFDDPSSTSSPGDSSQSRFTYSGGLNRSDFWRVALIQAGDSPLAGGGAGSFRSKYLLERETYEQPRDAHSLPLEILGELGAVGLLALLVAAAGAAVAAVRSRRLGPEAGFLSAAALTVAFAWGAQACVDWSWSIAGLTAPAIGLLGAAAATSSLSFAPLNRRLRLTGVAIACALAVIAMPTFVSARLTLNAAKGWEGDLDGAYRALDAASDLNPLTDLPALVRAEIARQNSDLNLAVASLAEARKRQPDEFQNYLIAAQVLAEVDRQAALRTIEEGLVLNPRSRQLLDLRESLTIPARADPG